MCSNYRNFSTKFLQKTEGNAHDDFLLDLIFALIVYNLLVLLAKKRFRKLWNTYNPKWNSTYILKSFVYVRPKVYGKEICCSSTNIETFSIVIPIVSR